MWHANVVYKLVLSCHAFFKYISKYASKDEIRSEIYQEMLKKISNVVNSQDPSIGVYNVLFLETIID